MNRLEFKLFACCIPVRGALRSTICDLQRQTYKFIPNALYEILTDHREKTLLELEELYGLGSRPALDEYFQFLEDNQFGFWTSEPDAFPPLDLAWDRPERVGNAIIDTDERSDHDYASLLHQLDSLGCSALQLRFFCRVHFEVIEAALAPTRGSRLRSIDLLLRFNSTWKQDAIETLCIQNQRIAQILVHDAPEDDFVRARHIGTPITYRKQIVETSAHCGFVHPRYFAINVESFTESQSRNSCLNRKISVDSAGEIKNCPAMSKRYGNAADTALINVLAQSEFRTVWDISKDRVETCCDCEFRYICTDCRALLRNPSNPLSKPLRCGYDPYSATWSDTTAT
jgi:SPASM domain peptide maturase of grasp-with-spasm system